MRVFGGKRAFALIIALQIVCVLLLAVMGMLTTSSRNLFSAGQYHRRLVAQQAAEAGLARAMSTLEGNLAFQGTISETLPHSGAEYRLDIISSGVPGPLQSVNNLQASSVVSSPTGNIPANSAFLVSRGVAGSTEVVLKALVQEADETMSVALLASNRIRLFDDVQIRGLESLNTNVPMPAGLHSNYTGSEPAVSWQATDATHRLKASGNISASSANIQLNPISQVQVAAVLPDQPKRPHLNIDIREMVRQHSSSPAPPTFPPGGSVTIPSGSYYLSGTQTLNGDLELSEGSTLYIEGDLTVNGSITGVGTVVVTGFTAFKGSANVSAPDGDYLAVLSRQGVSLTGFDGSAYLDGLGGSNPTVAMETSRLRSALNTMQEIVAGPPSHWAGEAAVAQVSAQVLALDAARSNLGNQTGAANRISEQLPSGATADFLRSKFYQMRLLYHMAWHNIDDAVVFPDYASSDHARRSYINSVITAWLSGVEQPDQGSPADAITSHNVPFSSLTAIEQAAIHKVKAQIEFENLDKPGTAFFKGLVYTNGPLYVGHELTVVGALEAQAVQGISGRTIDSVDLDAGDIYLAPNSDLVYVGDLLRSDQPLGRSGTLKVVFSYVE